MRPNQFNSAFTGKLQIICVAFDTPIKTLISFFVATQKVYNLTVDYRLVDIFRCFAMASDSVTFSALGLLLYLRTT